MKRKIVIAILCAAVSMGTVGCGNSTASAKKTQTQTDKKKIPKVKIPKNPVKKSKAAIYLRWIRI